MTPSAQAALPAFEVWLAAPDISRWVEGNTGIPGFTTYASRRPGPHVLLLALAHGNEIAGAIALHRLLLEGLTPARGRLSFGFVNLAAFQRFDPRHPTLSRFIDEDMNRIWDASLLDGPRWSVELERARQIRPIIDSADVVLDLHSMLWPSDPLILCGETAKGRALARAIGTPALGVADKGHASGRRILDYDRFSCPDSPTVANLVEAGQHWQPATVDTMLASVSGLLGYLGLCSAHPALPAPREGPRQTAEVTTVITAMTGNFTFAQPWRGGEVITKRDTLIATDGTAEICTPYDDCLLVMPSLRPSRGHTAIRLARLVSE
jgi:predicted deacylase